MLGIGIDLEEKIIKWWNSNGFFGYVVEDVQDIQTLLKIEGFDTLKKMMDWYQIQADEMGMNMNYYKDFVDHLGVKNGKANKKLSRLCTSGR